VTIELNPFLPKAALEIARQLGLPAEARIRDWDWDTDVRVSEPRPIFPRLERSPEAAEG